MLGLGNLGAVVDDPVWAPEVVGAGALDVYYYGVPSGLLEGPAAEGLHVYAAPGGSRCSLLPNPAAGDALNPFRIREVRFTVNYLVDRWVVMDELLGGSG